MDAEFFIGIAECLISTVLYGSAFVPIKPFYFGDGIYSLQIRSVAVLVLGVFTAVFRGTFHFYPVVMIGGMFWAIANLIVLPCIGELGLAITVLLYSFTNCLTNWFTGYFGLFWTRPRPPTVVWMNYVGLACLLVGGALIAFVRSAPKPPKPSISPATSSDSESAVVHEGETDNNGFGAAEFVGETRTTQKIGPSTSREHQSSTTRRIIAIGFSLLAGFFYGENVTPVVAVQDHPELYPNAPPDGLSYCLSHFMGIFCTASVIFFGYCLVKRNRPFVSAQLTLPSLLSGLVWGGAQTLFIDATGRLSQAVCGPIGAILPGCVASAWSVAYFGEIRGRRAVGTLAASAGVTGAGAALLTLSKNL